MQQSKRRLKEKVSNHMKYPIIRFTVIKDAKLHRFYFTCKSCTLCTTLHWYCFLFFNSLTFIHSELNVHGVVWISKSTKEIQTLSLNDIPSNACIRTDLAVLFNLRLSASK